MGASHSREGDLDSQYSEDEDDYSQSSEHRSNSSASNLGSRLQGLSLDDNVLVSNETQLVRLYKHVRARMLIVK